MANASALEQFQLELINRARLDPEGEAARLGIGLNAGLPGGTISAAPKQPLAFNGLLIDAARDHSDWMLDNNRFDHRGEGGSSPGDRMREAGYRFTGSWTWGENISWRGTTGTVDQTGFTVNSHEGLFRSAGHRENMLNGSFEEIGLGILTGQFTSGRTYNALMVTQNYAKSGDKLFVTGVAYQDSDGDDFYSPGEGLGGVRVTFGAGGADGTATTTGAGGYQQLVDGGPQLVTFSGQGLSGPLAVTVDIGNQNVKLDVIGRDSIASSADATAGQNLVGLSLLGIADIDATGNGRANRLVGNKGDNTLTGGGGSDSLEGGAGDDRLDGGSGTDTAIYQGNRSSYQITESGGGHTVRSNGTGEGTDILMGIERVQFADQTVELTGTPPPPPPPPDPGGEGVTLIGTRRADSLVGQSGPDLIQGHRGDDTLDGGAGNDLLDGGRGEDLLEGGPGDDSLDGGRGRDTAVYLGNRSGYRITESGDGHTIEANGGGEGTDRLISIEQVRFADQTLDLTDSSSSLPAPPPPPDPGGEGVTLIGTRRADSLAGESGPDVIKSHRGDDSLDGGGGDDLLEGGRGNDSLQGGPGNDSLDGGKGRDTAVFSGQRDDYQVSRDGDTLIVEAEAGGGGGLDRLTDIETLVFSDVTLDATTVGGTLAASGAAEPALSAADLLSGLDPSPPAPTTAPGGADPLSDLEAALATPVEPAPLDPIVPVPIA